jgi:hypothetical protein
MDIAGIGGIEDQLAGEHESRPRQQRFQNVEFECRQRNRLVLEGNAAPVRIDREPAMVHGLRHGRRSRGPRPPQNRIHPRHQFARAERFCHVVVAADFQA